MNMYSTDKRINMKTKMIKNFHIEPYFAINYDTSTFHYLLHKRKMSNQMELTDMLDN